MTDSANLAVPFAAEGTLLPPSYQASFPLY